MSEEKPRPIVFVVNTGEPDPYSRVGNQGIAVTFGERHTKLIPFPRNASSLETWTDWACRNLNVERKS